VGLPAVVRLARPDAGAPAPLGRLPPLVGKFLRLVGKLLPQALLLPADARTWPPPWPL
jgi:hypothetical protein